MDVLGTCPRCDMLSVDQEKGLRGKAGVLLELAQYRRMGGKMHFGVLLAAGEAAGPDEDAGEGFLVRVGHPVVASVRGS